MIDERQTAQASRYVLGALSAQERRDFEAAMFLDPRLQLLVQQLRGTAGAKPVPPPPAQPSSARTTEPPPRMDSPQTATAAPSPPVKTPAWVFWTPWLLTVCLAALCAILVSTLISSSRMVRAKTAELTAQLDQGHREIAGLRREIASLDLAVAEKSTNYQQRIRELEARLFKGVEQITQQSAALTNQLLRELSATNRELAAAWTKLEQLAHANKALEDAVTSLGSRERDRFSVVRLIVLRSGQADSSKSLGAAFWSPNDQRGVLAVESLPALPATQGYQLWLVDGKTTVPVSGGLLPVNAGSVRVQFTTDIRIDSLQRIFITIESALGRAAPQGRTVLSGE